MNSSATLVETSPFPLDGILAHNSVIEVGWPRREEFDLITLLRNRPEVLKWFVDPRPLQLEENRLWLAHGMKRPQEGLLAVRWRSTGHFLGTVGWSHWNRAQRTADFGRLMLDVEHIAKSSEYRSMAPGGIALAASELMRDLAFMRMGIALASTSYMAGNRLAGRINCLIGMEISGESFAVSPTGNSVHMVELSMTRERWRHVTQMAANA